jgi:uncharacterized protein (DUF302 family)
MGAPVIAGDVEKQGDSYYIRLPAELEFEEVFGQLKNEIMGVNWEIVHVQNVDTGLNDTYGLKIENKVISVCQSLYLSQAISDDPMISLIVPCRFTVFRDPGTKEIVIGFADPAAEARAIGIKKAAAATVAANDLIKVLVSMQKLYGN